MGRSCSAKAVMAGGFLLFCLGLLSSSALGASFTWSGGSGAWTVAANWSPQGVPGNGDTASIGSGSVTIADGEDIVVDALVLTAGSLSIAGSLTVDQNLQWSGGTLTGSGGVGIPSAAIAAVSGSASKTLSGSLVLTNEGTLLWSGGTFTVNGTARIDNLGLFDITHAGNLSVGQFSSTVTAGLSNGPDGIIRKREGTGVTLIETIFDFANQGLVEIQTGTLQLRSQTVNSGQMTVASGAIVDFTSQFATSHLHTPTSSLAGEGEIRFTQGATTIGGAWTFTGLTRISGGQTAFNMASVDFAELLFSSGVLGGDAEMTFSGDAVWQGGTWTGSGHGNIPSGIVLGLESSAMKTLSGSRELRNQGTLLWADGAFTVSGTARIDNLGLFDIIHAGNLSVGQFSSTVTAVLSNGPAGIIRKRQGTGVTLIETVFDFDNQGLVEVQSGTLQLRSQTVNSGQVTVAGGAIVDFTSQFGRSHLHTPSSSLAGDGEIRFSQGTSTVGGTYSSTGTTTFRGGTVISTSNMTLGGTAIWEVGTLTGEGQISVLEDATLSLVGGLTKSLTGELSLANFGTLLWSEGMFHVQDNVRIDNLGLFDITHAGNLSVGQFSSTVTAELSNGPVGIIRKRQGTGVTLIETIFDFDNQGLVEVQAGVLAVRSRTHHSGNLLVLDDARVEFSSQFGITHTLASAGRIGGTGEIRSNGGVVVFESTLAPGLPGQDESSLGALTISPSLVVSANQTVEIGVGQTGHDRILTPGSAQLDGTLEVILTSGGGPGGSKFEIVSAGQDLGGTFASLSTANAVLPAPRVWEVIYEPARALLLVGPDQMFSDRFEN